MVVAYTTNMNTLTIENFAKNALGRLVGQSHFTMIRSFAGDLKAAGLDITVEQCRILFCLYQGDGRMQQEISDYLLQEKSSTSRLLNSLEEKGYLKRVQGEQDERQKLVFLTPKGRSIEGTCLNCAYEFQIRVQERFSPEEWTQLITLLQKLNHVVKTL